jgi:hypothetical protein
MSNRRSFPSETTSRGPNRFAHQSLNSRSDIEFVIPPARLQMSGRSDPEYSICFSTKSARSSGWKASRTCSPHFSSARGSKARGRFTYASLPPGGEEFGCPFFWQIDVKPGSLPVSDVQDQYLNFTAVFRARRRDSKSGCNLAICITVSIMAIMTLGSISTIIKSRGGRSSGA